MLADDADDETLCEADASDAEALLLAALLSDDAVEGSPPADEADLLADDRLDWADLLALLRLDWAETEATDAVEEA